MTSSTVDGSADQHVHGLLSVSPSSPSLSEVTIKSPYLELHQILHHFKGEYQFAVLWGHVILPCTRLLDCPVLRQPLWCTHLNISLGLSFLREKSDYDLILDVCRAQLALQCSACFTEVAGEWRRCPFRNVVKSIAEIGIDGGGWGW